MARKNSTSLSQRRLEGKLKRYQDALLYIHSLKILTFEDQTRLHRLIFGTDPDLDSIPNQWPPLEDE